MLFVKPLQRLIHKNHFPPRVGSMILRSSSPRKRQFLIAVALSLFYPDGLVLQDPLIYFS